jgi:hypothetical protein
LHHVKQIEHENEYFMIDETFRQLQAEQKEFYLFHSSFRERRGLCKLAEAKATLLYTQNSIQYRQHIVETNKKFMLKLKREEIV